MNLSYCIVFSGTLGNIFELIGLIIVFILILFATYYTSKWVAKNGVNMQKAGNIQVIETYRLSQTKYLQIVKTGKDRYFLISVTKDNVSLIAELDDEDIDLSRYNNQKMQENNFSLILKNVIKKNK